MSNQAINTADRIKLLFDNYVIIYPEVKNISKVPGQKIFKFAVIVEDKYNLIYKKDKIVGKYKHTTATINQAIQDCLVHISNKLLTLKPANHEATN